MTTTLENRHWHKVTAGVWIADTVDHHFEARDRVTGGRARWRVTDNGKPAIHVATLKEAQDWVRRNYCETGWTVHADTHERPDGSTFVHHCVAITVNGSGPYTHHEALQEAGRLNGNRCELCDELDSDHAADCIRRPANCREWLAAR